MLITWPRSLESVSIMEATAATTTDSVTTPTCSVASTRWRAPTSTRTSVVNFENPACSTARLYGPAFSVQEIASPLSFVDALT